MLSDFDLRQIDPKAQLLDLDRADAESSLYEYLKAAWHIFDPAPWQDGWCIEAIAEHLEAVVDGQIKRLCINIPPRCSKSAICSAALTGWTWAQQKHSHTSGPGVSFLYASYREDLAIQDSRNCRRVIESDWYRARWGDRFSLTDDQNTKQRFNNDKGGYRMISSVESKGSTGFGANIIVLDDCNSAKEFESEAVTASTIDWFDGTLGTRLNNQKLGAVIQIQQRVGERDLTGHIQTKTKGGWDYLILPMEFETWRKSHVTSIGWSDPRTEEGELLWPERFDAEVVTALKDWMMPWRAAGQLQQRPAPKGGGIIERDWWRMWESDQYPPFDFILACLDTAYTESQMNDPSGMIIWGVFSQAAEEAPEQIARRLSTPYGPSRTRGSSFAAADRTKGPNVPKVLLTFAWEKHLKLHELVTTVEDTCRKFKVDLLLIENKASGISVAQELRRLFGNSRFGVQLFDPKSQDKTARLNSVQPLFVDGLIYAPSETRPWVEKVVSQAEQFPKARHDEFVDCISMGLRYLRDNGMICRVVEREAELEELKRYHRDPEPLYSV
jgi:predicted phage terminase large subunit-like protein